MPPPFSGGLIVCLLIKHVFYRASNNEAVCCWVMVFLILVVMHFRNSFWILWTTRLFRVGKRWAICPPRGKTGPGYGHLTQWQDMCVRCTDFSIVQAPEAWLAALSDPCGGQLSACGVQGWHSLILTDFSSWLNCVHLRWSRKLHLPFPYLPNNTYIQGCTTAIPVWGQAVRSNETKVSNS